MDTPKTKDSVRYIRLPDQTMELLAEYRKWYREEKFRWGDKWEDNDYLFPRENGAPMFPGCISHRLGHAHVSTTTDIYSHVIKEAEELSATA